MTARVAAALAIVAALTGAGPAWGWWSAGGAGTGTAPVATLATGQTPGTSVAGQAVAVTWAQTTFLGTRLGTRTGGGYRVVRYASGSTTPVTPGAGCAGVVAGSAASLSCTESAVPLGRWTYAVVPVLNSFSGDESAASTVAVVAPTAPATVTATAQNPAVGSDVGAVRVDWSAVAGATGYDVYRRVTGQAFGAPLNGATPVTATTLTDTGLTAGTTYEYVVRAIGGGVTSPASAVASATPVSRPGVPTAVTAQAVAAARVAVGWTAPAGTVAGYDVYRRPAGGTLDATPLNGGTLVTGPTYTDTTAVDGAAYRYVVRAVLLGAGGARVEGAASAESAAVTADGTPPAVPTAVVAGSGTTALAAATCGFAVGARFFNGTADATRNAAGATFTVTLPAVQAADTVTVTATTSTAVTQTVAATGTTLAVPLSLAGLADGSVSVTAVARDAAGNASAERAATATLVKDTVATAGTVTYEDVAVFGDRLGVPTECGTAISATRTAPSAAGPYTATATVNAPTATTLTVASGGILGQTNVYAIGLTDLAGNTGTTTGQGVSIL